MTPKLIQDISVFATFQDDGREELLTEITTQDQSMTVAYATCRGAARDIVKCVNLHEQLVSALEGARELIEGATGDKDELSNEEHIILNMVRSAIAAAKE